MADISLGPRGLTIEQQKEIAIIQSKAARELYKPNITTQTSLYVGELSAHVNEARLIDHFGNVKSAHVYRDSVMNHSLGYAHIKFHTPQECGEAYKKLKDSKIDGTTYRLMVSERDTTKRVIGTGNVILKNLHPNVDNKSLYDTFSRWGNVTFCRIASKVHNGSIHYYGYVNYDTYAAAERAILFVNGKMLFGKEVQATHQMPKNEKEVPQISNEQSRFTNVYVKNLSNEVTEDNLNGLFSTVGPVSSILIQRDDNNRSRGFGFVNYDSPSDAEKAVNELHETDLFGKKLFVTRAQKRSERDDELKRQHQASKYPGVNLYIKNLAEDVTDELLVDIFSPFGSITSAKVMREEQSGMSKGFGFVCFSVPDDANHAVAEMNGQVISSKPIYVALAQRKEDRRIFIESQLSQKNKYPL